MEELRLMEPSMELREELLSYIRETIEAGSDINGVGGLNRYLDNYEGWLQALHDYEYGPIPEGRVRGVTRALVRLSDNRVVGMCNIRYELNEALMGCGGHIGYSIRPSERRQGYNRINLYQALEILAQEGVTEAILDCNQENLGSSRTMMALGGVRVNVYTNDLYPGEILERYVINIPYALETYRDLYSGRRR